MGTTPAVHTQVLILHQEAMESGASTGDWSIRPWKLEPAIQLAESAILHQYVSREDTDEPLAQSQGHIWAAMDAVHAFSEKLCAHQQARSTTHERILQIGARLLYHQATHGPYQPNYLRAQLGRLAAHFPANTIFLSLLAWAETGLVRLVDGPLRALLRSASLAPPHDCVAARVFAVRHELAHGTAHSARAALEAALASDAARACAPLWLALVRHTAARVRTGRLRRDAAAVLYRALAAAPWYKDLYLEAFRARGTPQELGLDAAELRGLAADLFEKGLRVHRDMEEVLV